MIRLIIFSSISAIVIDTIYTAIKIIVNNYLNDCTTQARQIWEACYSDPFPKHLAVRWSSKIDDNKKIDEDRYSVTLGKIETYKTHHIIYLLRYNDHGHNIYTANSSFKETGIFYTLVHEFTHYRHPDLKHGSTFNLIVDSTITHLKYSRNHSGDGFTVKAVD